MEDWSRETNTNQATTYHNLWTTGQQETTKRNLVKDVSYLFTRSGSIESLAKSIEKQLREASPLSSSDGVKITPRDVARAMALAKAVEGEDTDGGVGLKEILAKIKDGTLGENCHLHEEPVAAH